MPRGDQFTITGTRAVMETGYAEAARLSRWSLTHQPAALADTRSTLTAVVEHTNAYVYGLGPTHLRVLMAPGCWWRWPIVGAVIHEGRATVTVAGRPEVVNRP